MNEQEFLTGSGDGFAIYQLKHDISTRDLRFASMAMVEKTGKKIDRGNYELIYTGKLEQKADLEQHAILEELYARFNLAIPEDFAGHSLSMSDIVGVGIGVPGISDIVALRQSGHISFHYVDTFGFRDVKSFLPDNLLHSAEIGMEDDYNMIDGIVGNNGINPAREEKPEPKKEPLPLREQLKQVIKEHQQNQHPGRAAKAAGLEL